MAHQRVIIWFPNGDAEFYAGFDVPSVGDRITRNNSDWIVARVESHIDKSVRVTVMPSEVVRDDSIRVRGPTEGLKRGLRAQRARFARRRDWLTRTDRVPV